MKLTWTRSAQENMREIQHRMRCRQSDEAADMIVDAIISKAKMLLQHPESGHNFDDRDYPDARQILAFSYRIIYRVRDEEIEVLNVFHAARQFPGRKDSP
jgi:addiction module RelE/StbE family toxin